MNPVVGLDVAEGESQIQAFLDKKKPFQKNFKVEHTLAGLEKLHSFLSDVERITGVKPLVEEEKKSCRSTLDLQLLHPLT